MTPRTRTCLLLSLLAFAVFLFLTPNPFGNNTDVIGDEFFFQSEALRFFQSGVPPGLQFGGTGVYYGGLQTSIITMAYVPVFVGLFLWKGSVTALQGYLVTHLGDLLHFTRLITGVFLISIGVGSVLIVLRLRDHKKHLFNLAIFGALLCGSSVFVLGMHTAKMWAFLALMDICVGVLVYAQEAARAEGREGFISPRLYASLLLWFFVFSITQSITGAVSLVWIGYALYLRHVRLEDFIRALRTQSVWIFIFLLLHLSFFTRGFQYYLDYPGTSPTNLSAQAFIGSDGGYDYLQRFRWPLEILFSSQPLLLLVYAYIIFGFLRRTAEYREGNSRRMVTVAVIHPVIIYLYYYALLGLGHGQRYALPLVMACSLSVFFMIRPLKGLKTALLTILLVSAVLVSGKAAYLYWKPSSEVVVEQIFSQMSSGTVVFVEAPRINLPTNRESLKYLSPKQASTGRFQAISKHPEWVDAYVHFSPIVISGPYVSSTLDTKDYQPWTLTSDCQQLCRPDEISRGTCIGVNEAVCVIGEGTNIQDIATLLPLLRADILGYSYTLRRVSSTREGSSDY